MTGAGEAGPAAGPVGRAGPGSVHPGSVHPGSIQAESIRPVSMRWWDIEQLARLEQVLFPADSPWSAAMFWSELAQRRHYVVVRDRAGRVDGYAGLAVGPDQAEVQTIGVRPDRQGVGIGRALLQHLIEAAGGRRVLLEVRTDNEPAKNLYASEGFRRIGVRRRYYQPSGADAYTMERV